MKLWPTRRKVVAQTSTQARVTRKSVSSSGISDGASRVDSSPDITPTSSTGWFRDMQRCSRAAAFADGVMSRLFRIAGNMRSETWRKPSCQRCCWRSQVWVSAGSSPGTGTLVRNSARQPLTQPR